MPSSRAVRIAHAAGGPGYTTRRRAGQLVRRGVARWLDIGTIAMVEDDRRVIAAHLSVARMASAYDRAAHTGIASIDAIRHLPVAGPVIRLLTERARRTVVRV